MTITTTTLDAAPAPIIRLARISHGDAGPCACCDRDAATWYRASVLRDGYLVVAARYCAAHDPDENPGAAQRLGDLTVADVARMSPRRAHRALRRAQAAEAAARTHRRAQAASAGASSMTHRYAIMGAHHEALADGYRRLAAAASARRADR